MNRRPCETCLHPGKEEESFLSGIRDTVGPKAGAGGAPLLLSGVGTTAARGGCHGWQAFIDHICGPGSGSFFGLSGLRGSSNREQRLWLWLRAFSRDSVETECLGRTFGNYRDLRAAAGEKQTGQCRVVADRTVGSLPCIAVET